MMKKITKILFGKTAATIYLFAGAIFFTTLPTVLKSFLMVKKRDFLSREAVVICDNVSYALVVLSIFFAFLCAMEAEDKIIERVRKLFAGVIPLIALAISGDILTDHLLGDWMKSDVKTININLVLTYIIAAAVLLFMTYFVFFTIQAMALGKNGKGYAGSLFMLLRHFHISLFWLLMMAVLITGPAITDTLIVRFGRGIPLSVTTNVTRHLVQGLFCGFVVEIIFVTMRHKSMVWNTTERAKETEAKETGTKESGAKDSEAKSHIYNWISQIILIAVGLTVCILLPRLFKTERTVAGAITEDIGTYTGYGSMLLLAGDYGEAYEYMNAAQDHIDAWNAFFNEDADSLKMILRKHPNDVLVRQLYVSLTKDYAGLEQYMLLDNVYNRDMRKLLLMAYNSAREKDITEYEKSYWNEILYNFAAGEMYESDLLDVSRLSEREKEKISKELEKYEVVEVCRDALGLLCNIGQEGSVGEMDVFKMADIADAHPENMLIQYMTGLLGAKLASDNASYYGRVIACLSRYIELCGKDKSLTKAEKYNRQLNAVNMLLKVEGYGEIIEIIDEIDAPGKDDRNNLLMCKMYCYEAQGDSENCYLTAKSLLDTGQPAVYYYYGVGALQHGKADETIDALSELSRCVRDEKIKGEDLYTAESALFILSEYFTINDSTYWTKFSYEYYDKLSDEQLDRIKKNAFLYDYLNAVYTYYNKKGYDAALTYAENVLGVREGLPYAQYLKGAICYNMHDFETSVKAYKSALDMLPKQPMFWYALANSYDALKLYKEAYEASYTAYQIVPTVNHEEDWYGIGYHNKNLMDNLARMLEDEER